MTTHLNDPELTALLLDADPVDIAALRELDRTPGAVELRAAITADAGGADGITAGAAAADGTRHLAAVRRLATPRRLAVLAAAAAVAIALPLVAVLVSPGSSNGSAYAAAVTFAEQSPRLLISQPGWRVVDLDQYAADEGDLTFAGHGHTLDLEWDSPANTFDPIAGKGGQITAPTRARIAGRPARLGPVPGPGPTYYAALWTSRGEGLRIRGGFTHRAAFEAAVTSLRRVPVSIFLAALPSSVVTPEGRRATVTRMLADIPQPPGFDPSALVVSDLLLDRYQLGAHVTGAVSCAWYQYYRHGSHGQRARARHAMSTSRHWAVLRRMAREGGYPEEIWEGARYLDGAPIPGLAPGETRASIIANRLC